MTPRHNAPEGLPQSCGVVFATVGMPPQVSGVVPAVVEGTPESSGVVPAAVGGTPGFPGVPFPPGPVYRPFTLPPLLVWRVTSLGEPE